MKETSGKRASFDALARPALENSKYGNPEAKSVLLVVAFGGSSLGSTGKDGRVWRRACRAKQSAQIVQRWYTAWRAMIDCVYTVEEQRLPQWVDNG